jgi:hypothetical protein
MSSSRALGASCFAPAIRMSLAIWLVGANLAQRRRRGVASSTR